MKLQIAQCQVQTTQSQMVSTSLPQVLRPRRQRHRAQAATRVVQPEEERLRGQSRKALEEK